MDRQLRREDSVRRANVRETRRWKNPETRGPRQLLRPPSARLNIKPSSVQELLGGRGDGKAPGRSVCPASLRLRASRPIDIRLSARLKGAPASETAKINKPRRNRGDATSCLLQLFTVSTPFSGFYRLVPGAQSWQADGQGEDGTTRPPVAGRTGILSRYNESERWGGGGSRHQYGRLTGAVTAWTRWALIINANEEASQQQQHQKGRFCPRQRSTRLKDLTYRSPRGQTMADLNPWQKQPPQPRRDATAPESERGKSPL